MIIYHEYDNLIEDCPFCASSRTHLILHKKRAGRSRKYYPGYRILCFNCWAGTASYFFIMETIKKWNTRIKILNDFNKS